MTTHLDGLCSKQWSSKLPLSYDAVLQVFGCGVLTIYDLIRLSRANKWFHDLVHDEMLWWQLSYCKGLIERDGTLPSILARVRN